MTLEHQVDNHRRVPALVLYGSLMRFMTLCLLFLTFCGVRSRKHVRTRCSRTVSLCRASKASLQSNRNVKAPLHYRPQNAARMPIAAAQR